MDIGFDTVMHTRPIETFLVITSISAGGVPMKCTVYCVELAHSTVYFGECCTCCSTYSAPNGTNMASDLYLLTSSFMVAICLINLIIILCIPDEESDDKRLMARE